MIGFTRIIRKKTAEYIRFMILAEITITRCKQRMHDGKDVEMYMRYQERIKALSDLKDLIDEKFNL